MIDWDNATPEQLAEFQRELRARSRPGYVGVAIWWVLDLLVIGLGIFLVQVVRTSTVSDGAWLPLAIVFALCGAALLFIPVLVRWTLAVAPDRAAWDQEFRLR